MKLAPGRSTLRLPSHNLYKHAEVTLIEHLIYTNIDKELLKYRVKQWEDFWIIELKTLQPHEFNVE